VSFGSQNIARLLSNINLSTAKADVLISPTTDCPDVLEHEETLVQENSPKFTRAMQTRVEREKSTFQI
jgi:hypothetical protein